MSKEVDISEEESEQSHKIVPGRTFCTEAEDDSRLKASALLKNVPIGREPFCPSSQKRIA